MSADKIMMHTGGLQYQTHLQTILLTVKTDVVLKEAVPQL